MRLKLKVKACPNCGSKRVWSCGKLQDRVWKYNLECAECRLASAQALTRSGAVIRWNLLRKKYIPKH